MNRGGFLNSLLKATLGVAVAPTILPAATTYARKWIKGRGIFVPSDYWNGETLDMYRKLPFYLAKVQIQRMDRNTYTKLFERVKWQPNIGNILRNV